MFIIIKMCVCVCVFPSGLRLILNSAKHDHQQSCWCEKETIYTSVKFSDVQRHNNSRGAQEDPG